jgi:NADPH:quinone reductase-like Zn-dependent oxidoreductase
VNPTDLGLRQRGAEGLDPPWVPGMDAAGAIESVGPGVERLAVGDPVMAAVMPRRPEGGAQAGLVVVPAASVVAPPAGATIEQAATLPMNGLTAFRGLELLDLEPGATLAVTGGAGLLASYVIPLAKRQGLHVLADAKHEDEELVRSFGADEVLPRGDGLLAALRAQAPGGVDAVYDTALLGRALLPAIRPGGALAFVRTWDGEDVEDGINVRRVQIADVIERTGWLEELAALAAEGLLALRVAETFPPERAADAHRLMEGGGLRGRALIVFD